jgi:hypothetical protein
MIGPFEGPTRTGFGLGSNLPVYRINNTFQINDALSIFHGDHSFKFGVEVRRSDERHRLFSSERGNLVYESLSAFVNDQALSAAQSLPMNGGDLIPFYRWSEVYFFAQDQWKVTRDLTLTYGVRYEYPGDSFKYLRDLNNRIVAANNDDPRFVFGYSPASDRNNWMPRVGFSWNPSASTKGLIGRITGGKKLAIRGGYARTYDPDFINIQQNIFPSFPFSVPPVVPLAGAFAFVTTNRTPIIPANPLLLTASGVTPEYRSPATDQFALTMQREIHSNLTFSVGWIRTRGTGLLQTIEGNPRPQCLFGTGQNLCNTTGVDRNTGVPLPPGTLIVRPRIDPTRGQITLRTNSASSTYDALQTSLERRLSRGISFALHYTFSAFIDTASDALNASSADFSVPQDLYDQRSNKARSSFDRPHRITGNIVYELPFFSGQVGFTGKLLGGWQVNSFFGMQSGAPITVFNGSDPAGTGNVNAMRPNVYSGPDLSRMSISELYFLQASLVAAANAQAQQNFANLPAGPCVAGWLSGPPLPLTLFSAPRARVVCSDGVGSLVVEFNGIPEGQRIGNAGRNILRTDGFANVDLGIIKNTRINESMRAQVWFDFFNLTNSRNFGIPATAINDAAFLDQWLTDGGNRRIRIGARLVF